MPRVPLPTDMKLVPVPFPTLGVDVEDAYSDQRPLTTAQAVNVRTYEALSDRGRGGSRPGLARYINDQLPHSFDPTGTRMIQDLNIVVYADSAHLDGNFDPPPLDPFNGLASVVDPSNSGSPDLWGTGALGPPDFNTGPPYVGTPDTGASRGTRAPPRSTRHGGTANQPNKNLLTAAGGGGTNYYCTAVTVTYLASVPLPNIGGFDGQKPAFTAVVCLPWIFPSVGSPVPVGGVAVIDAKCDFYTSIVNQKATYKASILVLGNSAATLTKIGLLVTTPNPINICDPSVANFCMDPRYPS